MANDEMELQESWSASKSMLLNRAIGLSDVDRSSIPSIYANAWHAARKAHYAYPAAKARAEIAAKKFISEHEPKVPLSF